MSFKGYPMVMFMASTFFGKELNVIGSNVSSDESPDIPIIGVGEGTWPSMRTTLQKIGISEKALLTQCDATFKQGTEFVGWRSEGSALISLSSQVDNPPSINAR